MQKAQVHEATPVQRVQQVQGAPPLPTRSVLRPRTGDVLAVRNRSTNMCSGTRASRAHQGILWVQNCQTCARLFRIGRKIRGGICGILKQRKSAARAAAKSKRPKASEAITATQRVGTQTGSGAGTQGAAHAPVAGTAGRPADEHSPVSALAKQAEQEIQADVSGEKIKVLRQPAENMRKIGRASCRERV